MDKKDVFVIVGTILLLIIGSPFLGAGSSEDTVAGKALREVGLVDEVVIPNQVVMKAAVNKVIKSHSVFPNNLVVSVGDPIRVGRSEFKVSINYNEHVMSKMTALDWVDFMSSLSDEIDVISDGAFECQMNFESNLNCNKK